MRIWLSEVEFCVKHLSPIRFQVSSCRRPTDNTAGALWARIIRVQKRAGHVGEASIVVREVL